MVEVYQEPLVGSLSLSVSPHSAGEGTEAQKVWKHVRCHQTGTVGPGLHHRAPQTQGQTARREDRDAGEERERAGAEGQGRDRTGWGVEGAEEGAGSLQVHAPCGLRWR